jgi:hypothetical protein
MKKLDNIYSKYQSQVKTKDVAVTSFIEHTLAITQSMFKYDGLPESIPQVELERMLQEDGKCAIAKVGDALYALGGSTGGKQDAYGRPLDYIVANTWLKLNKTFRIGSDCVLMKNDTNGQSLLPVIGKYAVLYTDGLISLNTASILTRITMLISASDDKTKQSADEFLKKILNGDFSVIGENSFFKGVSMQTANVSNSQYIAQLVELVQYYRASMLNELGLNANYNMKRERLNLGEVSMNVDVLLPYVENMINSRREALAQVNDMFGTDIRVDLNSSWKLEHENFLALSKDIEKVETEETEEKPETKETTETEETSETEEKEEKKET